MEMFNIDNTLFLVYMTVKAVIVCMFWVVIFFHISTPVVWY